MHPVLFRIGDFPVGSYALMALLGLLATVLLFSRLGAREPGERWAFVEMGLWAFIVAIATSKVFGALTGFDPEHPGASLRHVLRFGGHYWVGVIAALTFLFIALRRRGIGLGHGLDALAPALALGHAIGRLGCFLAGCCWGRACDAPWAVTFTSQEAHDITGVPLNVALHPTQLYEFLAELAIAGIVLVLHLRARRFEGQTILNYLLLYGVVRFLLEELRGDPRGEPWAGLSSTQALLIPTFIVAAVAYVTLWRRQGRTSAAPATEGTAPRHGERRLSRRKRRR